MKPRHALVRQLGAAVAAFERGEAAVKGNDRDAAFDAYFECHERLDAVVERLRDAHEPESLFCDLCLSAVRVTETTVGGVEVGVCHQCRRHADRDNYWALTNAERRREQVRETLVDIREGDFEIPWGQGDMFDTSRGEDELEPVPPAALLLDFLEVAERLGRVPLPEDVQKHAKHSIGQFFGEFERWDDLVGASGLTFDPAREDPELVD